MADDILRISVAPSDQTRRGQVLVPSHICPDRRRHDPRSRRRARSCGRPASWLWRGAMHAAFAQFRSIRQDAQDNMVSMATKLTAILRMSSATELPGAMQSVLCRDVSASISTASGTSSPAIRRRLMRRRENTMPSSTPCRARCMRLSLSLAPSGRMRRTTWCPWPRSSPRMSSATELYALPGAMHAAFAQFRSIRQDAQDNMVSMATKLTAILRMSSASRSATARAHAYWFLNSPFSPAGCGDGLSACYEMRRCNSGFSYRVQSWDEQLLLADQIPP